MAPRRLLALVAIVGLTLAGLVLPVAAQTAPPTISITQMTPRCIDRGGEGFVAGSTNRPAVRLEVLAPSGKVVSGETTTGNQGTYSNAFGFAPAETGEHQARVTAGTVDRFGNFTPTTAQASVFIQVPCRAPTLEYDPACSTTATTQVRMTGRLFHPLDRGYFDLDLDGDDASRILIDNRGTFTAVIGVKPASVSRQGRARDLEGNVADASWPPCPPGTAPTTTTSTTTTTAPPVITPDPDPTPDPTTTTTTAARPRPGDPVVIPSTTTLPPAIELPPPTVGATLTVTPAIGPPGFVTGATGTGFPPGPVELVWLPGIGTTTTVAGPDGTISLRVLVFPGDRLGPRALVATGGGVTALAGFLVVPSTVQPSGQDVSQINRIRRFNNR